MDWTPMDDGKNFCRHIADNTHAYKFEKGVLIIEWNQ